LQSTLKLEIKKIYYVLISKDKREGGHFVFVAFSRQNYVIETQHVGTISNERQSRVLGFVFWPLIWLSIEIPDMLSIVKH
jgi:hypothetical protein